MSPRQPLPRERLPRVPRAQVTGIVLAGGRSTRFGAPKLAATIGGSTVLQLAVDAVDRVAGAVLVAGPADLATERRFGRSSRFIADAEPFAGPLAALAGALPEAATDLAIVVGGDMPGLVPAVLQSILDRLATEAEVDAVVLQPPPSDAPPRLQVLPVALRVGRAATAARAALDAGDRSLVRFLGRIRVTEVPAEDWLIHDPKGESTFDIDVPGDFERFLGREIR